MTTLPDHTDISVLPLDHPGAHDSEYRARRDFIAELARTFHEKGGPIPTLAYTPSEERTWRTASAQLALLHDTHASEIFLKAKKAFELSATKIPQLAEVSARTKAATGFEMQPVAGLVKSRDFLSMLGKKVFLSTQYIRHASRPEYTPEPDIIHEILGHSPMFAQQDFADFSERIGKAAMKATDEQIGMLDRLYWFAAEFGLIQEGKNLKAFGAGLLSSIGEIEHAFTDQVERLPFNIKEIVHTNYDYSSMQKKLFIIPSFSALRQETLAFLDEHNL